ncbi:MAG TPA: thiamine-phosphate kinase [Candidatus Acidoferrales bacterium]|nr:thiamine-phosphate kinase [Candidatus Acidoferrales bacterium]
MKLAELGEFGLIERIQKSTPKGKGVLLGIGDDAAWLKWRDRSLLVTADVLIEGFHFDFAWTSPYELGYKALAVNLSDIAAMGGTPSYFVTSLGVPADFEAEGVEEIFRGMRALSTRTGAVLVGGDTSAADRLVLSVCLFGRAPHRPVSRQGARVGDDLYVTGTLGDSSLGLELLKTRGEKGKDAAARYLFLRHRFPAARLRAGAALARRGLARAMIDVSDGLLQDLGHICRASGVGAVVWEQSLPLSRAYRSLAGGRGLSYALSGGEDYELLFAAPVAARARLEKSGRSLLGVKVTRIGTCVASKEGIKVVDRKGQPLSLPAGGYDHFKH